MSKRLTPQARIRSYCLSFPEAIEVEQFGHPFFKWRGKPFTILSGTQSEQLSIKVEKELQPIFLEDPRFTKTAYVGQHGWVTLQLTGHLDWEEVESLIEGSFRLVSSKKQKAKIKRK
ncbi:MmcQ/YjbR family DNA-binding protein [Bryobacter aggregatus]|uniref:MmcQ/YjbR family DNA-binding protein n=1 Tax=Bryobacter aggregatus TaxID=360054 RepID=UPI00068FB91A|nr:MmcQ/YjbR family DNA-binding protein [Bryobacter aggregatus]